MQSHTQLFALLAFALVFLPMAFLFVRAVVGMSARQKVALAAVFATFLLFFFGRHQQDLYRGLDNLIYANMAKAFRSGIQAIRVDQFFASIPEDVAKTFYFDTWETTQGSTTSHDKAFVIFNDGFSRPWFMVMHPLVASVMPEGLFMPLLGAVWLTLLFALCCRGNGVAGIVIFLVCVFATPYPLWFFRDDYAEVAGSVLVATALLSHVARPLKNPMEFATAAFLVGLATAFHRSTFLFALPVALLLFSEAGTRQARVAVVTGFFMGCLALFLETRYVSAPYGDWTRTALPGSATDVEGGNLFRKYLHLLVPRSNVHLARAFWPGLKSLGIMALPLFLAGCFAIVRDKESGLVKKVLPFLLVGVLLVCMGRMGGDVSGAKFVGIWNFRRICPCVIIFLSLFARPLSDLMAGILGRKCPPAAMPVRRRDAITLAVAAVLCVLCISRSPAAYFAIEGKGSRKFAEEIGDELGRLEPDLVVFDYYLHHLPFVFDGRFHVLGFGGKIRETWAAVEEWIADVAKTQRVVVVSSWTPPRAEKNLRFKAIRQLKCEYGGVAAQSFLDAVPIQRHIQNTLLLVQSPGEKNSVAGDEYSPCMLPFDGGPLGMRGEWTPAPRGGMWSRPSSGFVGPLPDVRHSVELVMETSWLPPKGAPADRDVTIEYPGNHTTYTVSEGRATNTFVLASDTPPDGDRFGEYKVSVTPLFDPAQYGIPKYPDDLGIIVHSVTLTKLPDVCPSE